MKKNSTIWMVALSLCSLMLAAGAIAPPQDESSEPSRSSPESVDVTVRIEGPADTVWRGDFSLSGTVDVIADNSGLSYTIDATTPLGALELASQAGGFELNITDRWVFWDLFVNEIDGIGPSGFLGWLYRVNAVMPFYGPGFGWQSFGPELHSGDEILWAWGMGELPLRVEVAEPHPIAGSPFPVRAEAPDRDYFHIPGDPFPIVNWVAAPGVTILLDSDTVTTDNNGVAMLTASDPGTYEVRAEGTGHVRSDRLSVTVALGVELTVHPDTINRDADGLWVQTWLELPAGWNFSEIDRASLCLAGVSVAEIDARYGFVSNTPTSDIDGDGLSEFLVKFNRAALADLEPGIYPLTLEGLLTSGVRLYGESQPLKLL